MQTAELMQRQFAGLGWYIRRTPDSAALAEWYGGSLGLPLIRGRVPVWFFWGGSTLCFELKSDVAPRAERFTDPARAPMYPVFASRNLEGSLRRLEASDADIVLRTESEVFLLDTDRQLVCVRESSSSPFRTGGDVNVGASPLPTDLHGWGWTVCRVPDVAAEAAFYREVCGLECSEGSDCIVVDIGGDVSPGALLELRGGGEHMPPPSTREQRTDAIIFRIDDHDQVNAALKSSGVPIVNDAIRFNSASLTYVLTPSGCLVGFEERFEPARYRQPRREFLEDREAIRRRHKKTEEQDGR